VTISVLSDAFAHHVWATVRVIDACAALTPEQLGTPVPGTYGSIIDTLRHLVTADSAYLWALSDWRIEPIDGDAEWSLAELRSVMATNGPAWADVVAREMDPNEDLVPRPEDDPVGGHAPTGIRIAQVVHHGTDHRSQVCTALSSLGVTPPLIDVWDFAETNGRDRGVPAPR
jgi:uncharacterized damage-inducible protein DinB